MEQGHGQKQKSCPARPCSPPYSACAASATCWFLLPVATENSNAWYRLFMKTVNYGAANFGKAKNATNGLPTKGERLMYQNRRRAGCSKHPTSPRQRCVFVCRAFLSVKYFRHFPRFQPPVVRLLRGYLVFLAPVIGVNHTLYSVDQNQSHQQGEPYHWAPPPPLPFFAEGRPTSFLAAFTNRNKPAGSRLRGFSRF